jgi:hypothetical protein
VLLERLRRLVPPKDRPRHNREGGPTVQSILDQEQLRYFTDRRSRTAGQEASFDRGWRSSVVYSRVVALTIGDSAPVQRSWDAQIMTFFELISTTDSIDESVKHRQRMSTYHTS